MGLGEIILGEMGLDEMGLGEMGQNPRRREVANLLRTWWYGEATSGKLV